MSKQVPNRLVQVDDDLLEKVEMVLYDGKGYRLKRLRAVVRMAYLRGYCDGYRDGHTDAENGHDERVRAILA